MVTRRPHATFSVPPPCPLRALLVASLALACVACASAAVENVTRQDAAGTGGTGGNGGQGGTTTTCDPFSNAGCSAGDKCTALQNAGALELGCGSKGSRSAGETCTQVWSGSRQTGDDCGDGLACFELEKDVPTCHRICAPSASTCACATDELCALSVTGLTGHAFCRPVVKCKPLAQEGCAATEGCYFSTSACFTGSQCAGAGSKQPGEACMAANECRPGSTCLSVGNGGTCSSFCSTAEGGTPACTGGEVCDALGGQTGEPDVGSCRQRS